MRSCFHTTLALPRAFFPPEGSVEASHARTRARTHAPSTRDVGLVRLLLLVSARKGPVFAALASPTVFSKNKPETLLIKGRASVCV